MNFNPRYFPYRSDQNPAPGPRPVSVHGGPLQRHVPRSAQDRTRRRHPGFVFWVRTRHLIEYDVQQAHLV